MDRIKSMYLKLDTPAIKHLLFWVVVFLFHTITANREFYSNTWHLLEVFFVMTLLQAMVAYTTIYLLIPKFLSKRKNLLFGILLTLLLVVAVAGYHTAKYYYLEPAYPQSYALHFEKFGYLSVPERVADVSVTISKAVFFFSPTLLLLLFQFYRNQQRLSKINEQKKTAELTALKHQLNPHFLFNTLNNVYALAVKKSDKTPEVISKLSDILDYMLYRCDEDFVSIEKEIELIENYLMLEKIRYGTRVAITFDTSLEHDASIAPLLLLTFVENAFKHGVSQEIDQATIDIRLQTQEHAIAFYIKNTIPSTAHCDESPKQAIGLNNVKQQMELLYPGAHRLQTHKAAGTYVVTLNIKTT